MWPFGPSKNEQIKQLLDKISDLESEVRILRTDNNALRAKNEKLKEEKTVPASPAAVTSTVRTVRNTSSYNSRPEPVRPSSSSKRFSGSSNVDSHNAAIQVALTTPVYSSSSDSCKSSSSSSNSCRSCNSCSGSHSCSSSSSSCSGGSSCGGGS